MIDNIKIWLKKWLSIVMVFLIVLLIAFILGRCSTKKERSVNTSNLIAARDSVKKSYILIDGLRNSIYEKNAIVASQQQAIDAGIIREDLLKKLHLKDLISYTDLHATIKVLRDSLKIQPGTIIITVKDTSGLKHDYVRIPFTLLNIEEKYLSLNAGMKIDHSEYFNLQVPIEGNVSIGYKSNGLFKKKVAEGIFSTTNPYVNISNMDVVIIDNNEKWYQKWWLHMIAGGVVVEGIHQLTK